MRVRIKLVLAITAMVSVIVISLSVLYLSQLLSERIRQTYEHNSIAAHQVVLAVAGAIEHGLKNARLPVNDPEALNAAITRALENDNALQLTLNSFIRYAPTIYDINIADSHGQILLSTDPLYQGKQLPPVPSFTALTGMNSWRKFRTVFGPPAVYGVDARLDRNHAPFLVVRVGVRTTFLRSQMAPWLHAELVVLMLSMLIIILLAALLSNMALHPLQVISDRLDQFMLTEPQSLPEPELLLAPTDEISKVSDKIERIGKRMRSVEEVFTALKENLDQVLENLQDGVMLFTQDAKVIMVSDSMEHFLGLTREQMLGMELHDIFDRQSTLGQVVRRAFNARKTLMQEEITIETGRRVQVSLDFIHSEDASKPSDLGTLLTLHDSESMRQIETELEVSRRLADLGRLTSGVGHEVKNPINAIVVHLELLREKINRGDNGAERHVDVIHNEIRRLDRVVQTLVDFSRPVELDLGTHDLRSIVSSVLTLAEPELEQRSVHVFSKMPDNPVLVRVDSDLIQQALLNVLLNGAQSMAEGGQLAVELRQNAHEASLRIRDQGCGIPNEILGRIFNLYFTTKRDGTGIGLAMTYRILQLHNGSVQVESEVDVGTQFTLRLPTTGVSESKASLKTSVG